MPLNFRGFRAMGLTGVRGYKGVDIDLIKDCTVKVENCGVKLVKCKVKMKKMRRRKRKAFGNNRRDNAKRVLKHEQKKEKKEIPVPLPVTYSTKDNPISTRTREKWFYPRHRVFKMLKHSTDNKANPAIETDSESIAASILQYGQNRANMEEPKSMIKMRMEYLKTKENLKNLKVFCVPKKVFVKFSITESLKSQEFSKALVNHEGFYYPKDEVDINLFKEEEDLLGVHQSDNSSIANISEVLDEMCPEDVLTLSQVWPTIGSGDCSQKTKDIRIKAINTYFFLVFSLRSSNCKLWLQFRIFLTFPISGS